jgi:hypothetical protein
MQMSIDQHLSWKTNTENICKKISALRRLKVFADEQTLLSVYNAIVRPYFDYCCEVWVWRNAIKKTPKTTKQSCSDYHEYEQ